MHKAGAGHRGNSGVGVAVAGPAGDVRVDAEDGRRQSVVVQPRVDEYDVEVGARIAQGSLGGVGRIEVLVHNQLRQAASESSRRMEWHTPQKYLKASKPPSGLRD